MEVCNILFGLSDSAFVDILCYIFILVSLILCLLIYNKTLFTKNVRMRKIVVFVPSVFIVIFLSSVLVGMISKDEATSKDYNNHTLNEKVEVKDISMNKVIVVGDSRMEYIENDSSIDIPVNMSFVARAGMKIEWFKGEAMERLDEILSKESNYTYHVILNMGVNDLSYEKSGKNVANNYYNLYNKLFSKYPNVKFYILSINPIDEKLINITRPSNIRTNYEIENANLQFKRLINEKNTSNVSFCDSYNSLAFDTEDGLHYTRDTNQEIINYIAGKCVAY